MIANRQFLEKVLDNRASSWAGLAAVLPLLLAIIFLGSITYTVGQQAAPLIEKILTPPVVQEQEKIEFEETLPSARFENVFEEFEADKNERLSVPALNIPDDSKDFVPVHQPDQTDVAMSDLPDEQAKWEMDKPSVDLAGSAIGDQTDQIITTNQEPSQDAVLRRAGSERPAVASGGPKLAVNGGANLGKDTSGDITPDPAASAPVVISSGGTSSTAGVGINQPASREKLDLTGWILKNPSPLRPAVAEALGHSAIKADRTSVGSVVDAAGKLYQLYFLHRTENNLLRILVVEGDKAYRIDLPDFYLEANHVKTGRVSRGAPPADSFDPGPIIEVALESVAAIPAEVPVIFDLVLQWLEIKGQE